MESKKYSVSDDPSVIGLCSNEAEEFVKKLSLDKKTTLRIRLLSEEVLEMLRSMVGEFEGEFWLESDDKECRICVTGAADINIKKEKDLLSASKDGVNESVKGFTAKLSQLMRHYKEYVGNMFDDKDGPVVIDYMYLGEMSHNYVGSDFVWSLCDYREFLDENGGSSKKVEEEKDELEKSIVASIADDVKVGVKGDNITITVIKKIA